MLAKVGNPVSQKWEISFAEVRNGPQCERTEDERAGIENWKGLLFEISQMKWHLKLTICLLNQLPFWNCSSRAQLWNWYSRLNSSHHSDAFINDGLSLFAWLQELPILNNWDLIKFLLPRISPIRTCRGAERGRGAESDVAFLDFGFQGEIDV